MRVIYRGDPAELERGESLSRMSTTIYGVTFPMSAEVDVSHLPQKLQQKLLNNPHFTPAGVDAPAKLIMPTPLADSAGAESADELAEEEAEAAAHAERAATRKRKAS